MFKSLASKLTRIAPASHMSSKQLCISLCFIPFCVAVGLSMFLWLCLFNENVLKTDEKCFENEWRILFEYLYLLFLINC